MLRIIDEVILIVDICNIYNQLNVYYVIIRFAGIFPLHNYILIFLLFPVCNFVTFRCKLCARFSRIAFYKITTQA